MISITATYFMIVSLGNDFMKDFIPSKTEDDHGVYGKHKLPIL